MSMLSGSSARVAFVIALGALVVGVASLQGMVRALKATLIKIPIEAKYKLPSIPEELPSWKRIGADEQMSEEMVTELGTENYISRAYMEKNPPEGQSPILLSLHMTYYTGMVDTVPHIPDQCLVAAGWSIAGSTGVRPLNLDQEIGEWRLERDVAGRVFSARLGPDSKVPNTRINLPRDADKLSIRVNPYTEPKSNKSLFAGYYFIANGGHCDNAEDVRLLAFQLQDTYAYYLKVQISTSSVETEEEYVAACRKLLSELLPEIMLCAPDWVELQRGLSTATGSQAGEKGKTNHAPDSNGAGVKPSSK